MVFWILDAKREHDADFFLSSSLFPFLLPPQKATVGQPNATAGLLGDRGLLSIILNDTISAPLVSKILKSAGGTIQSLVDLLQKTCESFVCVHTTSWKRDWLSESPLQRERNADFSLSSSFLPLLHAPADKLLGTIGKASRDSF